MNKIKAVVTDKYFLLLLLIFFIFLFLIPTGGYIYDKAFWYSWTVRIKEVSLTNIYQFSDVNYMPLFLYVLAGFGKVFGTSELIWQNIHLLKIVILFFDFFGVYLVARLIRNLKINGFRALFILFNVAFLFNTLFWGQVDGLYTFFVLGSILLALKNKSTTSLLVFLVAINIKLQAVIFGPLILLLVLPGVLKNRKKIWTEIIKIFLSLVVLQVLIFLPFLLAGKLQEIWHVIVNSAGFYQNISFNAYNFWYLILGPAKADGSDTQILFIFSYRIWGLIMFGISFMASIFPIIRSIKEKVVAKSIIGLDKTFISKVFLSAGLIALSFFFFSTEMHERYIHPAIIMFGIYALLNGKVFGYIAYGLISVAYFLNLEAILKALALINHSLPIFSSRFNATIFLIVLVIGFYRLYKTDNKVTLKK